jgi:hypothetical protein
MAKANLFVGKLAQRESLNDFEMGRDRSGGYTRGYPQPMPFQRNWKAQEPERAEIAVACFGRFCC